MNGRFYALGRLLAREQQRNAALQQQLEHRTHEIDQLRAQVEQLKVRENDLRAALEQAVAAQGTGGGSVHAQVASAGSTQGAAGGAGGQSPNGGSAAAHNGASSAATPTGSPEQIASLRARLVQEQQRREAAETELQRLKEETSSPAYGDGGTQAAQLAAAKQQVVELQQALAHERTERERMADDLRALQERLAQHAAPNSAAESDELQRLRAEKDAIVASFNQTLAASQQRTAELERQLAAARDGNGVAHGDGEAPGAVDAIRAENTALRTRLDEEHRRTEALAAKLKIASRVTDLIFRMQAQQASAR